MNGKMIQIENSFQHLRRLLIGNSSHQYKLVCIAGFYRQIIGVLTPNQLGFYFREIVTEICEMLNRKSLVGISPEVIQDLIDLTDEVLSSYRPFEDKVLVENAKSTIKNYQLELNMYLGEWTDVFAQLGIDIPPDWEPSRVYSGQTILNISSMLNMSNPAKEVVENLYVEFLNRMALDQNGGIVIPVVDHGCTQFQSSLNQGVLLPLTVRVTPSMSKDCHLVFFNQILLRDNQLNLKRLQNIYKLLPSARGGCIPYNMHLDLGKVGQMFTGFSYELGFAMALEEADKKYHNSYGNHEVELPRVITGVVAENGDIEEVNESSLEAKIKATFFSQHESIMIPQANKLHADQVLFELKMLYPNKHFSIETSRRYGASVEKNTVNHLAMHIPTTARGQTMRAIH